MKDRLIGRSLKEAKELLSSIGIDYVVKETRGFKDEGLLKEPYVIAVRSKDPVILVVSYFFTKINGQ